MRPNDDVIAATVLLARFSAGFTALVDLHLGSDWAENAEILALVSLRHDEPPTTRQIAELSGLNRRSVSRLSADSTRTASSSPSPAPSTTAQ